MNIQSIRPAIVAQETEAKPKKEKPEAQSGGVVGDSFMTEEKQNLMGTLRNQPDVRPDVVERGKSLAVDPDYPSADVISKIAELFISEGGR